MEKYQIPRGIRPGFIMIRLFQQIEKLRFPPYTRLDVSDATSFPTLLLVTCSILHGMAHSETNSIEHETSKTWFQTMRLFQRMEKYQIPVVSYLMFPVNLRNRIYYQLVYHNDPTLSTNRGTPMSPLYHVRCFLCDLIAEVTSRICSGYGSPKPTPFFNEQLFNLIKWLISMLLRFYLAHFLLSIFIWIRQFSC